MKKRGVYKITNTVENKFYIGSTGSYAERVRTHRARLRDNRHHSAGLQEAWNRLGEGAFVFHLVEEVEPARTLEEAENKWLDAWVGTDACYNVGRKYGAPWKGAHAESHPMHGKPRSEETKAKLRDARLRQADPRLGHRHSEETKELLRQIKLAKPERHWLGKTRDEETRRKISEAQKGVPKGPRTYTADGLRRAQENMRRNAMEQKPLAFENVMAKFPAEVRAKYDFSKAIYAGALVRIEGCVCPEHGEFSQYAAQFRKGRGCPSCGKKQGWEARKAVV